MKIIIAPDKFKGSRKSIEACDAIKEGILEAENNIEVLLFPMADGGDGFAEVMKYYLRTETQFARTVDPLGRNISASYEWNKKDFVDKEGNIFISAPGDVWILSPDAKLLGKIVTPERSENMAWGGEDGKTQYFTAHSSLYKLKINTGGKFSWQ